MPEIPNQPIILVAESDQEDRLLLEAELGKSGLEVAVYFVGTWQELMDYIYWRGNFSPPTKAPFPHLLFLDLYLPDADIMEILSVLKRDPAFREIPVVLMVSSLVEGEYLQARSNFDFLDVVVKPITAERLHSLLELRS
jgi:two-component system response regulator